MEAIAYICLPMFWAFRYAEIGGVASQIVDFVDCGLSDPAAWHEDSIDWITDGRRRNPTSTLDTPFALPSLRKIMKNTTKRTYTAPRVTKKSSVARATLFSGGSGVFGP